VPLAVEIEDELSTVVEPDNVELVDKVEVDDAELDATAIEDDAELDVAEVEDDETAGPMILTFQTLEPDEYAMKLLFI